MVEKQSKCGLQVGQSVSKISDRDLSSAAGTRAIMGVVGKQSEYGLQVGQSVFRISDRYLSSAAGIRAIIGADGKQSEWLASGAECVLDQRQIPVKCCRYTCNHRCGWEAE